MRLLCVSVSVIVYVYKGVCTHSIQVHMYLDVWVGMSLHAVHDKWTQHWATYRQYRETKIYFHTEYNLEIVYYHLML